MGETQRLLQFLQEETNAEGNCILTAHIHEYMWPDTGPDSFFVMAGTAAQKTGKLDWLVEAYQTAMEAASRQKSRVHPDTQALAGKIVHSVCL